MPVKLLFAAGGLPWIPGEAEGLFATSAGLPSKRAAQRAAVSSCRGCAVKTGVVFDAGVVASRQAGLHAARARPAQRVREFLRFEVTQRLAVELQVRSCPCFFIGFLLLLP